MRPSRKGRREAAFVLALLTSLTPSPALFAQPPAAAPPRTAPGTSAAESSPGHLDVLAIGGFLGQLDGFCENPGGTYDLEWLEEHKAIAQGCPTANGKGPITPPDWRVALGGVLGAGTWLKSQPPADSKTGLIVVSGNNQVPNFAALGQDVLVRPTEDEREAVMQTYPSSAAVPPAQVPVVKQAQERLAQFWDALARLNPDIVGVGAEDFVRSLRAIDSLEATPTSRATNMASVFVQFVKDRTWDGRGLPLIASNAAIKLRTRGRGLSLNTVSVNGPGGTFALDAIDEDESVGWLDTVTITHPASAGLKLTLCESPNTATCETATPANDATSTKVKAPGGTLRPGTQYQVTIEAGGMAQPQPLRFRTHAALTPRLANPPAFVGFPVVARQPWLTEAPLLAVSLVDPDAKKLLGKQAWIWRGAGCPAPSDECEIDILPPADALRTLLRRSIETTARKPFVVLVSDLEDANTQALLDAYPEIRVTVLPPDSRMLGRASRSSVRQLDKDEVTTAMSAREQPRPGEKAVIYGGDGGLTAIVNQHEPPATMMMVRPEWVGETGARVQGIVTYSHHQNEWEITTPSATMDSVPGSALWWMTGLCRDRNGVTVPCVSYGTTWEGQAYDYGSFTSYEDCGEGAISDRCGRFFDLVTSTTEFNTVSGDLLRRASRAEMALVPPELLDQDFGYWLVDLLWPPGTTDRPNPLPATNFLSRFMLERAIYRSSRFVRATVQGEKLVATLKSAIDSAGEGSCIVGIGAGCVKSVNVKKPEAVLVNGRTFDPRLYYSIAMPDSLAEALSLTHDDDEHASHDAVASLHKGVETDLWYVAPLTTATTTGTGATVAAGPAAKGDGLGARITRRGDRRLQSDAIASTLELGYNWLSLGKPAGRGEVLQGLDVDFRNATPAQNWIVKWNVDLALIDTRAWAVRAVTSLDFNRRKDIERDPPEYAYTTNTLTYGGRWDVIKVRPWQRELRPYVGWFTERAVKGPTQYLNAATQLTKTDTYTESRTAAGRTTFEVPALRYEYWAAGADLMVHWKALPLGAFELDVTRLGLQRAWGDLVNLPSGISIGGVEQEPAVFQNYLMGGAKKVVGDYYGANIDTFDPATSFAVIGRRVDQERWQFDVNTEARLKVKTQTYKLTTEFGFRFYPGLDETAPLRLHQALRSKTALVLPFIWRFELVPTVEYQWAKIRADESNIFQNRRFEALLRFPFVARGWWGFLFN